MELREVFVEALKAIEEASVPIELRETAFSKAVDILSRGNGRSVADSAAVGATRSPEQSALKDQDLLGKIAVKVQVSADIIADIYEVVDGDIRVVVPRRKLDKAKMGATKQMALLVGAGRQAAELEESTAFEKVREAAEDYGIYDSNNFARTLSDMGDDFILSGTSRARLFRLRRPTWDKVKDLVVGIGGDEA